MTDRTPRTEAGRQFVDDLMVEFYEDYHSDHSQAEYASARRRYKRAAIVARVVRIEAEAVAALTAQLAEAELKLSMCGPAEAERHQAVCDLTLRAEQAEAQRDTLVDLLTNTVAINVHAYATGKAHPLGRFENCTAEVCVEWQKVLGDIPGWAKARDALIAAEAVEGALSVERLIPAVKYAFEAAQEWRPDPTHSYMNQPVWPFDKFAVALRAALRAALLAEPTAPQKEEDR